MIPGAKEGRKGLKNCKGTMDKGVLASFLVLLVMGLVVLYAASFYNAQDKSGGAFSEVLSQLQGIALGAAALVGGAGGAQPPGLSDFSKPPDLSGFAGAEPDSADAGGHSGRR